MYKRMIQRLETRYRFYVMMQNINTKSALKYEQNLESRRCCDLFLGLLYPIRINQSIDFSKLFTKCEAKIFMKRFCHILIM